MTDSIGSVELLGVSFGASARFEGRIADEIDKLDRRGSSACSY